MLQRPRAFRACATASGAYLQEPVAHPPLPPSIINYVIVYIPVQFLLFKVYVNDMIVAVEAAKQGATMGEDTVSGLCLRMISWGYQKHPKDFRNR